MHVHHLGLTTGPVSREIKLKIWVWIKWVLSHDLIVIKLNSCLLILLASSVHCFCLGRGKWLWFEDFECVTIKLLLIWDTSDSRSYEHYWTSSWNGTLKKNSGPYGIWTPWLLRYLCSALPTELTSQLGTSHNVGPKETFQVVNNDWKYMKIICLHCGEEMRCTRSSQLWTLLNL